MPLFRKKRSDASDGSSLSHNSTSFSLGRLGSKKRQNNNDNETMDPNKVAVVPNKAKKRNNSSSTKKAAVASNHEATVLAGPPRKRSSSSYPSEGRHVPLSLRLSTDEQDRSYGSSDVSLNTALSTVVVEKHGRCSPSSTPLKPATSIENQLYNLSAITDDILTAAVRIYLLLSYILLLWYILILYLIWYPWCFCYRTFCSHSPRQPLLVCVVTWIMINHVINRHHQWCCFDHEL